jgi:hypothetical protein
MNLGALSVSSIRLGASEVSKLYLGATEIYSNAATSGILDLYSAPAAAYSLRNLSATPSTFTNSSDTENNTTSGAWVAQVRRSSDNYKRSFTAAELTDGTLATWTGANDGFISIWYDQSSNANHTTDGSNSLEPKIHDATTGVIVDAGGNPAAEFNGSNYLALGTASTMTAGTLFTVANLSTADDTHSIVGGDSAFFPFAAENSTGSTLWQAQGSVTSVYVDGAVQSWATRGDAFAGVVTNSQVLMALEGVGTGTSEIANVGAGYGPGDTKATGTISEIIIYSTDESTNRAAIESNINSHYGIY